MVWIIFQKAQSLISTVLFVAEMDRTALPNDRLSDGKISEILIQNSSQQPKLRMSLVVMPTFAAAEEDAPLVECAENIAVSIPAAVNTALSQWATEHEVTALCGLIKEISIIAMNGLGFC